MAPAGIGAELEGFHAVAAATRRNRVRRLIVERRRLRHEAYAELVETARRSGVEVEVVDDVRPMAVTGAPQGVVARARPLASGALDEVVTCAAPAAVVVLDHLADPRNVGAVVRSAVAAGITGFIVASRRAAPLGATAFKAAAGAFEEATLAVVSSIPEALRELERRGVWRVGLDAAGDRSLLGLALLTEPVAVVVGAEGRGLARLVRDRCDVVARIPMAGPVESLNASAAATLAVFELARIRGWVS